MVESAGWSPKDLVCECVSPQPYNIDHALSAKLTESDPKYSQLIAWLLDNGATFESDIIYPAVFTNGLVGIAAKREIPANKAFIMIPASCIISMDLAKKCPRLPPLDRGSRTRHCRWRSPAASLTPRRLRQQGPHRRLPVG